jgi:hypothetical protein
MSLLEIHVALSLIEIPVGLMVIYALITNTNHGSWTALFLALAILTSLTGFPLAPFGFDPPRAIGVLTLLLAAGALIALYGFGAKGAWRWTFVITTTATLYLDVFIAVFQAFLKIPSLHALAPTQSEPPFLVAEGAVLLIFAVLGIWALVRFRPTSLARA